MNEPRNTTSDPGLPGTRQCPGLLPDAARVAGWRESLGRVEEGIDDGARVDLIAELERLKSAAAAVQARMAAAMADEQVAAATAGTSASGTSASGTSASGSPASGSPASGTSASGSPASGSPASGSPASGTSASGTSASGTSAIPAGTAAAPASGGSGRAGRSAAAGAVRSVAGQVGLARRVSPHRAMTLVGMARALCTDLPTTLAALAAGQISEWQATLVVRETVVLRAEDRAAVDAALAGSLGRLGDRALAREARRLADETDPEAAAHRARRAEADRRVSISPAPGPAGEAMARLSATLPVAQAAAAHASLRRHAETARAQGDPRTLGALMADELLARLAGTPTTPPIHVEIGLVMTERTLLRGGTDPAVLTDEAGRALAHVPAAVARRLVDDADQAWLTRLYAHPTTGQLLAMDSHRRTFTGRLRHLLLWRDQTCRTPWCQAPSATPTTSTPTPPAAPPP